MSALPSAAVTIGDGEITIADLLALKLGLSVKVLKSKMRRGYVYSVTEQGIDKDAGRARLTFRYRTRSWTVVVEPDGAGILRLCRAPGAIRWRCGGTGSPGFPCRGVQRRGRVLGGEREPWREPLG